MTAAATAVVSSIPTETCFIAAPNSVGSANFPPVTDPVKPSTGWLEKLAGQAWHLVGARPDLDRRHQSYGAFFVQYFVYMLNGTEYLIHFPFHVGAVGVELDLETRCSEQFVSALHFFAYGNARADRNYLYFSYCLHCQFPHYYRVFDARVAPRGVITVS